MKLACWSDQSSQQPVDSDAPPVIHQLKRIKSWSGKTLVALEGWGAKNCLPVVRDWASVRGHARTYLPCSEGRGARNRATVWTLTIRQQSWWSSCLTSVTLLPWDTPSLPPLWGHCSLDVTDSLLSSHRLVKAVTSSLSPLHPLCHPLFLFHFTPLPWGCHSTCLPYISVILGLDFLSSLRAIIDGVVLLCPLLWP